MAFADITLQCKNWPSMILLMSEILIFSFFYWCHFSICWRQISPDWVGKFILIFKWRANCPENCKLQVKLRKFNNLHDKKMILPIPKCGNLSSKSQKIIIWRWFLDNNISTKFIWIYNGVAKWILPTYVTVLTILESITKLENCEALQFSLVLADNSW